VLQDDSTPDAFPKDLHGGLVPFVTSSKSEQIVEMAYRHSFLGTLPERRLDGLLDAAQIIEYVGGSLVYDPQLSIIVSGAFGALVYDGLGRQLTVGYLQAPHSLGIANAAGCEFTLAFQALTPSVLLRFSLGILEELQRDFVGIAWAAASEIAFQLNGVLAEIARVAFQPVRARVAHHLLALTELDVMSGQPVRQAQIAAAVGSGREVVGRALTMLRDEGLVEIGRGGVVAINLDRLRRIASQGE
jgi:CRP-like cAMP-binding protein